MYKTKITVAPATLPVSLSTVKEYLRIDGDQDDASLEMMVSAATSIVEGYLRRALVPRTVTLTGSGQSFRLIHPPFISVVSVKDADGNDIPYLVNDTQEPAMVILSASYENVEIVYTCGYADEVPAVIQQEILNITLPMFERRGTDYHKEVDAALDRLSTYRFYRGD